MFRSGRAFAPLMVCSALSLPVGVAHAGAPPWGGEWATELRADHPLAGAVLDAATGEPLDAKALAARLADADVVLLGEKHDNPDHHRAQAWLLGLMVEAGRRPAVVMEMLDSSQGPALADYLAQSDATAAGLGEAVAWADSGWPGWEAYQPIADVALGAGLPILTGNLPVEQVRRVAMGGAEAALGADGLGPRALDQDFPESMAEALGQDIMQGHCGMLPESALPGMVAAQRARDGEMARAVLAGAALNGSDGEGAAGAVLIAGNGHVRVDRAVPWYLEQLNPALKTLSVGVLELQDGLPDSPSLDDLGAETSPANDLRPPYGLLVLTPALEDIDPCEKFRAQLERMRTRHGNNDGGGAPATE